MTSDGVSGDQQGGSDSNAAEDRHAVAERRFGTGSGGSRRAFGVKAGVGVAAVLGLGAAAAVLILPAHATDTPELVLRHYLQATLVDHDATAAAVLTCQTPQLDVIEQWEQDLAAREQRYDLPPLHVDVSTFTASRTGRQVTATTKIAVSLIVDGQLQQRLTRAYTFGLLKHGGWKVCSAAEAD